MTCGLAATLPIAASAARIVICGTCDPTLQLLTNSNGALGSVQATGASAVTYEFLNVTGHIIDNFVFDTTINSGLNPALVASTFTCQAPDAYFLACAVSYTQSTGDLRYQYYGVNPPDGDEYRLSDTERGQQEGIPTCYNRPLLIAWCEATGIGIFQIQLQGFTDNLTVGNTQFYSGLPHFTNSFNVPEPSAVLIFLVESLLFAVCFKRFGRRLNWQRRFDL